MLIGLSSKPFLRNVVLQSKLMTPTQYYFGTIKKFHLPDLGEKIKEATIKKWHVKEGDVVEEYQPLADVSTDKLFTQIPSSASGKIHKRYFKEEDAVQVGDAFIEIEVEEDGSAQEAPATSQNQTEAKATQSSQAKTSDSHSTSSSSNQVLATPAVRSIVREHKLDITKIKGTGKSGRVMKEDVLNYMDNKSAPQTKEQPKEHHKEADKHAAPQSHKKESRKEESKVHQRPASHVGPYSLAKKQVTMTDFQKGMQKSMTEALQIPHFYYKDEVDMTLMSDLRERINKVNHLKISFMPYILKAYSLALQEFPIVNAWYSKDTPFEYTLIDNINLSFAIASPKGLIVPNIKNCQDKSVLDIHNEFTRIIDAANNGTIGMKDLTEGTFTISNIGNIGGTYLGPVILPPQVAIVALGKTTLQPKYVFDEKGEPKLVPRKIMNASFGADHRVLDGATIAKFSQKWKSFMENPDSMLLYLR